MRHGARHIFGQVEIQTAAEGGVELLHADAHGQQRHLPRDQPAIPLHEVHTREELLWPFLPRISHYSE